MTNREKALAELEKVVDVERKTSMEILELSTQIRDLTEAAAGARLLAAALSGEDVAEGSVAEHLRLRELLQRKGALEAAAREEHRARVAAVRAAEAQELERKAAEIERQAADRQRKTESLLAQLQEHEGIAYQPVSTARDVMRGRGALPGTSVVYNVLPQSQLLLNQATDLRRRAIETARAGAIEGGLVGANSLEELLDSLHSEPLRVAPATLDVIEWAQGAAKRERARRADVIRRHPNAAVEIPRYEAELAEHEARKTAAEAAGKVYNSRPPAPLGYEIMPLDAPIGYRLQWSAGRIVAEASGTYTPAQEPVEELAG